MSSAGIIDSIKFKEEMWERAAGKNNLGARDFEVMCGDNSRAVVGMVSTEEAYRRLKEGETGYRASA